MQVTGSPARFLTLLCTLLTMAAHGQDTFPAGAAIPLPLQPTSSIATGTEVQPDNKGFLACVTRNLPATFRHNVTGELFSNLLLPPPQARQIVIAGHGASGRLCTGDGDQCAILANRRTTLDMSTSADWLPLAKQLHGRYDAILILACNVAFNRNGQQLLDAIAEATGADVAAPDSFIVCDDGGRNIRFPYGGQLLHSKANQLLSNGIQIQQPAPYKVPVENRGIFAVLGELVTVPKGGIDVVTISYRGYDRREFLNLRGFEGKAFVNLIDFDHPLVADVQPAAIVTGRFVIRLRMGDTLIDRALILYNNEVLEDASTFNVFYRVDSSLGGLIEQLAQAQTR